MIDWSHLARRRGGNASGACVLAEAALLTFILLVLLAGPAYADPAGVERASVSLTIWVGVGVIAIAGFELVRLTRHTRFDEAVVHHAEME